MRLPHKSRNLPGFTMIELLGALLIVALMMPALAWLWQKGSIELRKRAVAGHFMTVTKGAEKYLKLNHAALLSGSSAANGQNITLENLRDAQCLSDMTADINAWGQEYLISDPGRRLGRRHHHHRWPGPGRQ